MAKQQITVEAQADFRSLLQELNKANASLSNLGDPKHLRQFNAELLKMYNTLEKINRLDKTYAGHPFKPQVAQANSSVYGRAREYAGIANPPARPSTSSLIKTTQDYLKNPSAHISSSVFGPVTPISFAQGRVANAKNLLSELLEQESTVTNARERVRLTRLITKVIVEETAAKSKLNTELNKLKREQDKQKRIENDLNSGAFKSFHAMGMTRPSGVGLFNVGSMQGLQQGISNYHLGTIGTSQSYNGRPTVNNFVSDPHGRNTSRLMNNMFDSMIENGGINDGIERERLRALRKSKTERMADYRTRMQAQLGNTLTKVGGLTAKNAYRKIGSSRYQSELNTLNFLGSFLSKSDPADFHKLGFGAQFASLGINDHQGAVEHLYASQQKLKQNMQYAQQYEGMSPLARLRFNLSGRGLAGGPPTSPNRFNMRNLNYNLAHSAQFLGQSLYGLGVAGAVGGVVRGSINAYNEANQGRLVLGGVTNSSTQFLGADGRPVDAPTNFAISRRRGDALYQRVRQTATQLPLTTNELMTYFTGASAIGRRSGIASNDILDISAKIGTLGKVLGFQERDVSQDLRALFTKGGKIGSNEKSLTLLGINKGDRDKALEKGPEEFVKYIKEKLKGFDPALKEFADSFAAKWTTLVSKLQEVGITFGEEFVKGLLPAIESGIKTISEWTKNGGAKEFGRQAGMFVSAFGSITAGMVKLVTTLGPLGSTAAIAGVAIAGALFRLVIEMQSAKTKLSTGVAGFLGVVGALVIGIFQAKASADAALRGEIPNIQNTQNPTTKLGRDVAKFGARDAITGITSMQQADDLSSNIKQGQKGLKHLKFTRKALEFAYNTAIADKKGITGYFDATTNLREQIKKHGIKSFADFEKTIYKESPYYLMDATNRTIGDLGLSGNEPLDALNKMGSKVTGFLKDVNVNYAQSTQAEIYSKVRANGGFPAKTAGESENAYLHRLNPAQQTKFLAAASSINDYEKTVNTAVPTPEKVRGSGPSLATVIPDISAFEAERQSLEGRISDLQNSRSDLLTNSDRFTYTEFKKTVPSLNANTNALLATQIKLANSIYAEALGKIPGLQGIPGSRPLKAGAEQARYDLRLKNASTKYGNMVAVAEGNRSQAIKSAKLAHSNTYRDLAKQSRNFREDQLRAGFSDYAESQYSSIDSKYGDSGSFDDQIKGLRLKADQDFTSSNMDDFVKFGFTGDPFVTGMRNSRKTKIARDLQNKINAIEQKKEAFYAKNRSERFKVDSGERLRAYQNSLDNTGLTGVDLRVSQLGQANNRISDQIGNISAGANYGGLSGESIIKVLIAQKKANEDLILALNLNTKATMISAGRREESALNAFNGTSFMSPLQRLNQAGTQGAETFGMFLQSRGIREGTAQYEKAMSSYRTNFYTGNTMKASNYRMLDGIQSAGMNGISTFLNTRSVGMGVSSFAGSLPNYQQNALGQLLSGDYAERIMRAGSRTINGRKVGNLTKKGASTVALGELGASYVTGLLGENNYSNEGSQIGGMLGAIPAIAGSLGPWGAAVGMLGGGVLGSLFGKKQQDPQDLAYRQKIADFLSKIDRNTRPVGEYFRNKVVQYNSVSAYLSGRSVAYGQGVGAG